jgi:hypothetical protein
MVQPLTIIYGQPHKHILDFWQRCGYTLLITDLMKRVSRSQITPAGDELIFGVGGYASRLISAAQRRMSRLFFCLAALSRRGCFSSLVFLFARMWRLLLRIIPDGAVDYRPSRIFRDWLANPAIHRPIRSSVMNLKNFSHEPRTLCWGGFAA